MKDSFSLERASEHWRHGDPIEAGKLIFDNLEPVKRAKVATSVMNQVASQTDLSLPSLESLSRIANQYNMWREAHGIFLQLRRVTLELERLKQRSLDQELLLAQLYLAENVAKVVYNATEPSDPFDDDSAYWVVVCLKRVLALVGDERFSDEVWQTLVNAE